MTVPNPAPQPQQPPHSSAYPQTNPQQPHGQQANAQQPHGQQANAQQPAYPQQPYAQQPYAQQPAHPQQHAQAGHVPPVYDAGPPAPPRPPLTKAAARRARLAGGVGGGITWLGLGITQLSAALLALPVIVGAIVFGVGFAFDQDGTSATAGAWNTMLEWLVSPWGILLAVGIPLGIAIALMGLWVSTRMLRHPELRRPVGVTWAGFGISVAAAVLLSSIGSVTLSPFMGGIPAGGMFDFDGMGPMDPGSFDEAAAEEWMVEQGPGMLEQFADPGTLLGLFGPWIVIGTLLALILPIIVSIFTWWWMAHAMRPATIDATDADAVDPGTASAA